MGRTFKDKDGTHRQSDHLDGWVDPELIGFDDVPPRPTNLPATANGKGTEHPLGGVMVSDYRDNWKGGKVYKHCSHSGQQVIFSLTDSKKRELTFGGATGSSIDTENVALVLDLAHVMNLGSKRFIDHAPNAAWMALNSLVRSPLKVVRLDWTDQKGPGPVPLRFWQSAIKLAFHSLGKATYGHVVATCFGGHGRTGTCLASILIAHSTRGYDNVLDFIREKHCDQAIETQAQERYLKCLVDERDKKGEKS